MEYLEFFIFMIVIIMVGIVLVLKFKRNQSLALNITNNDIEPKIKSEFIAKKIKMDQLSKWKCSQSRIYLMRISFSK